MGEKASESETRTRARDLGIEFDGEPGPHNAITDVGGVEVGYCTLISGEGRRVQGRGPVRTGVTAILPRGKQDANRGVFAGMSSLNGNGELTGSHWAAEVGRCDGPITLTNTHSVGTARDASIKWVVERLGGVGQWALPVAGETFDGYLNDINGFHVTDEHVFEALDRAAAGPLAEGSVGGGTGMITYGFKGGSGTASRLVGIGDARYTIGLFVQSNFGRREQLLVSGVPVGRGLADWQPDPRPGGESGSIIAIAATDAPLVPHQLQRVARRIGLGIGRSGAQSGHGSGDIFMAFSVANRVALDDAGPLVSLDMVRDDALDPLFGAAISATDEAILNALVSNQTMHGADDHVVHALPHAELVALLEAAGRLRART